MLCAVCACAYSQNYNGPTTTPVPILKQINKQNDDGSYSFGYEAADGSFKIETKYPNGDVAGKYGYVDESGKVREVSYGASSQRGFEPEGMRAIKLYIYILFSHPVMFIHMYTLHYIQTNKYQNIR